jgi:hypothetical protein
MNTCVNYLGPFPYFNFEMICAVESVASNLIPAKEWNVGGKSDR